MAREEFCNPQKMKRGENFNEGLLFNNINLILDQIENFKNLCSFLKI